LKILGILKNEGEKNLSPLYRGGRRKIATVESKGSCDLRSPRSDTVQKSGEKKEGLKLLLPGEAGNETPEKGRGKRTSLPHSLAEKHQKELNNTSAIERERLTRKKNKVKRKVGGRRTLSHQNNLGM